MLKVSLTGIRDEGFKLISKTFLLSQKQNHVLSLYIFIYNNVSVLFLRDLAKYIEYMFLLFYF